MLIQKKATDEVAFRLSQKIGPKIKSALDRMQERRDTADNSYQTLRAFFNRESKKYKAVKKVLSSYGIDEQEVSPRSDTSEYFTFSLEHIRHTTDGQISSSDGAIYTFYYREPTSLYIGNEILSKKSFKKTHGTDR